MKQRPPPEDKQAIGTKKLQLDLNHQTHSEKMMATSMDGSVRSVSGQDDGRSDKDVTKELMSASPETLLRTAGEVVKDLSSQSSVFNPVFEKRIPKFDPEEVLRGQVLGRGGFCVVQDFKFKPSRYNDNENGGDARSTASARSGRSAAADEIRQLQNQSIIGRIFSSCASRKNGDDEEDSVSLGSYRTINSAMSSKTRTNLQFSRNYIMSKQRKTFRTGFKHGCYVVKSVSNGLDKMGTSEMTVITSCLEILIVRRCCFSHPSLYFFSWLWTIVSNVGLMKAHTDLAVEAKFLASLDHPNIIKLVGLSSTGPCTRDNFLILDRMESTLAGKIKEWEDSERAIKTLPSFMVGKNRSENLYRERLEVSHDITSALQFLHSKNVVYRDLKPQNCGFDGQNTLRIFDFGLARELYDDDKEPDGTYRNLTSMTGAVRYMAPEVAAGLPYNQSADVYSWSMLMFYMMALEPPFGFYTERMIIERSCKGYRPTIFKKWPSAIKKVLASAWDGDLRNRPSFLDISLVLKKELNGQRGTALSSASGKTTASSDDSRDVTAMTER